MANGRIDLQEELRRRQAEVDRLLAEQQSGVGERAAGTGQEIQRGRQDFAQNILQPALQRFGGGVPAQAGLSRFEQPLQQQLEQSLARRQRGQRTGLLDRTLKLATQRARQAGLSLEQAKEFGKQQARDAIRREFESEQAEFGRESQRRQQQIAGEFQQRGAQLPAQFDLQPDRQSAMLRALFGLAGAGTTAALTFGRGQPSPVQQQPTRIPGAGPTLQEQSGFVSPQQFFPNQFNQPRQTLFGR